MKAFSGDGSLMESSDNALRSIPDATSDQQVRAVRFISRQVEMSPGERYELLSALGLVDVAEGMRQKEAVA